MNFLNLNSNINKVAQYGHQMLHLWEFYFGDSDDAFRFNIQSITLPFAMIEQEKLNTGEHIFKGIETVDTFSIEVRETNDFSIQYYFDSWYDEIYDSEKKQFKTVKGIDRRYKTGFFNFSGSKFNLWAYLASLGSSAALQTTGLLAQDKTVSNITSQTANKATSYFINKAHSPIETMGYSLENCLYQGKSEISPTRTSAEPLSWNLTFSFTGYKRLTV
jgi:hypothetical protein